MPQNLETNRVPYAWDELFHKWEHDQLTTEQLGGQLLVRSRQLHEMIVVCQRELENISDAVDELDARVQGLEGAAFQDRLAG